MRKHIIIGVVLLITLSVLSACSALANEDNGNTSSLDSVQSDTNHVNDEDEKQEAGENLIIWWADLHHNGTEDKIVVEIIDNYATSEGAIISIYKGDTDILIYSFTADLPHPGWNGLHLYTNENDAYLLNWIPGMWQGRASYFYEVFYFDERDEKVVFDCGSLEFDSDDLRIAYEGWVEFIKYTHMVNSYLLKSWVLADTDGGILVYSTQDNQIVNWFYPPAHLFFPEGF